MYLEMCVCLHLSVDAPDKMRVCVCVCNCMYVRMCSVSPSHWICLSLSVWWQLFVIRLPVVCRTTAFTDELPATPPRPRAGRLHPGSILPDVLLTEHMQNQWKDP
jgi:hypothetical protein